MATPVDQLPDTDVDRLRVTFLRLARRIRTSSVELVTPSQLAVLSTIVRNGPLTISQIAEHEHVKPPSISKIVGTLEDLGFVERQTDPSDRRCAFIALTPAGQAYLDEVRAAGRTWLATRLGELDESEHRAIAAAMPVLERLLGSDE